MIRASFYSSRCLHLAQAQVSGVSVLYERSRSAEHMKI